MLVQNSTSNAMLRKVRTSYDWLRQVRSCCDMLGYVMIFYARLGLVRSG